MTTFILERFPFFLYNQTCTVTQISRFTTFGKASLFGFPHYFNNTGSVWNVMNCTTDIFQSLFNKMLTNKMLIKKC